MDALSCGWDAAKFLVISENVFAPLIYYSHLGPLAFSLLLGAIVLFNNPQSLVNRILFAITAFFSIWVFFDLVLWASEKPEYIMFFWSAIVPIELLIYASAWYLVAVFANGGKDISFLEKLVVLVTFVPMLLFAHTSYNLLGFDLTNCDREAIEGPLVQYLYVLELVFIGWTALVAGRGYQRMKERAQKQQLLTLSLGVLCFLILFSAGNIVVSYFLDVDWSYEQYKLIGMPIFACVMVYSAIRFRTFDLRVFTAQALIIALGILVFSLLFLRSIENVRIIAVLTFALVFVLGYFLIRSVRYEIEQRTLIQAQEKELQMMNKQQESLLHFVSHEVKGYLTNGQNAFAAIVEGDLGTVSSKVRETSQEALGKMRQGVSTVMDILDASNLKKGTVSYKKESFDLREAVEEAVQRMKPLAAEKHLTLDLSTDDSKKYQFTGDRDKIVRHVVRNLIDNAIRYTPKGHVSVALVREGDRIRFSVKDTGVGITAEDKSQLFTEGGHGKDSIKVNVDSTGYGLFIAKEVTEVHGGKIWAESAGAGKGSEFIVELPTSH